VGQVFGVPPIGLVTVDPFIFRLDPTSTAQFGTPRASAGAPPTVTAMVDANGRPFVRLTSSTANPNIVPLLGITATGRFIIEMRATWNGTGAGQLAGIGWNMDGATFTNFAVTTRGAATSLFDSVLSGVNENFTTPNANATDAAYEYAPMYVDVWLDLAAGACTYTYSGSNFFAGAAGFQQRRKVVLETAGASSVGLYTTANAGSLDIAELIIWKNPRSW
jgi:hypothetical protein